MGIPPAEGVELVVSLVGRERYEKQESKSEWLSEELSSSYLEGVRGATSGAGL